MVSFCCTFIVGAVLFFSGSTKVIDLGKFARHLSRYRLMPGYLILPAALLFTGLEQGLGMALMLHAWPQWLVPLSLLLFLGFGGLTLWGIRSGRVEDCGCYGGVFAISPMQSIVLDGLYALILLLAVLVPGAEYDTGPWKIFLSAGMMVAGAGLSLKSAHEPLIDLSYLKKGKQWKDKWLKHSQPPFSSGTHFVVFLDRECIFCKRWVPLLNVIHAQPELPMVSGIMSLSAPSLADFKKAHMIRFPIARMDKFLAVTMTQSFPTAILIENGVIVEKWEGEMPEAYLAYVKQFFESIRPQSDKKAVFSG